MYVSRRRKILPIYYGDGQHGNSRQVSSRIEIDENIDAQQLVKMEQIAKRQRKKINILLRGYNNMLLDISAENIRLLQDEFEIDNTENRELANEIIQNADDCFSNKPYRRDVS